MTSNQTEEFGPNYEMVLEVIRFALEAFEWRHAPREAPKNESLETVITIEPVSPSDSIDWLDVLDWQRAEYMTAKPDGITQDEHEHFGSQVLVELAMIDHHIEEKFKSILPQQIRDLTAGLFGDCALCRAAIGAKSTFWEGVFASLKSGGIPVGWSGPWPAGRMIVYYRP